MEYYELRVKWRKERLIMGIIINWNKKEDNKHDRYLFFWEENSNGNKISTRCGILKGVVYSCSCGFLGEAISTKLDDLPIFICPECNLYISTVAFGYRIYDYRKPTTKEKLALIISEIAQ